MRISDWSSDVCSSDLGGVCVEEQPQVDFSAQGRVRTQWPEGGRCPQGQVVQQKRQFPCRQRHGKRLERRHPPGLLQRHVLKPALTVQLGLLGGVPDPLVPPPPAPTQSPPPARPQVTFPTSLARGGTP